jgi:diguanylate cyclase (GGDEF)-like protein
MLEVESPTLELDESLIDDKVRSELARVFIERIVDSAYVAPLGILLLAWLISMVSGWTTALLWASVMVVIELLIIVLGHYFNQTLAAERDAGLWVRAQLVTSGLLGLAWGSAVWLVWVPGDMPIYLASLCVLVGVSGVCMVTMAPVRMATLMFSLGMLLPPLVQLQWIDNPMALQIALGWLVMTAVQAWTAKDLHQELTRELDSSLRNKALLQLLSSTSGELYRVNTQAEEKNVELGIALTQLKELVTHDQLTGAFSRRYIFEQLERHTSMHQRHETPVSVIMFDLDHFKSINDHHGHPVGDRALQEVVRAVNAQLRDGDMLARVGGEEFLVLLPVTDLTAARLLGERLRQVLASTSITLDDGSTLVLPASFGVAELHAAEGYAEWLRRADSALYQAKAQGRNALVAA